MGEPRPLVFIVDDEPLVRAALNNLLRAAGLKAQTFATAQEFLRADRPDVPTCLVLDVRLPDMSGLELQRTLAETNTEMPIVFITGHGDISMSVRAMKAGAVEFLTKPFSDQDLLDAVWRAIHQDRATRRSRAELAGLRQRYRSLSPREREVFPLIVSGMPNKQIAAKLAVGENTVKAHRSRVMQKMSASSLADLVRMAERLG
jgi:FixJ family two-component response regulator